MQKVGQVKKEQWNSEQFVVLELQLNLASEVMKGGFLY